MAIIKFYAAGIPSVPVSNKNFLKSFVHYLFKEEQKNLAALTYVFTTDDHLLTLNLEYLGHNTLTDVITFNLSEVAEEIIGEVYISVERVKVNAKLYQKPFSNELRRVIFHGSLHLCGYTDKKKSEITIIRLKEDHYLSLFDEKLKSSST